MIDPQRLNDLLHDVKAALLTGFPTAGVELPQRVYVANGDQQVAFDCEQVTIAQQVSTTYGGNTAVQELGNRLRDPAHAMRLVTIAIVIVRCAPTPTVVYQNITVPSVEDEERSAAQVYADSQIAFNSVLAAQKAGDLGSCNGVTFLDVATPGTSAGFASSKLRLQIGLE